MLTYSFNSQHRKVKNLPKGLHSGRISPLLTDKKKVTIKNNNKNSDHDNNNSNNNIYNHNNNMNNNNNNVDFKVS